MFGPSKLHFCSRSHGFCCRGQNACPLFFEKKGYKKTIFWKMIFSHFLSYLQKFLSHRHVQYLKLILWRHSFDHLKCTFALGIVVFAAEIKISVHFFLRHPLYTPFFILKCTYNAKLLYNILKINKRTGENKPIQGGIWLKN